MSEYQTNLPAPDEIRMVFLDLDGTALNSQETLSQETIQALTLLRRRGIPYTFASARPAAMLRLYCQQARVTEPVITLEGAEICDPASGVSLYRQAIPEETAVELMSLCCRQGADFTFYTPRTAYFPQHTCRVPRFRKYNDRAAAAGLPPVSCAFYDAYDPRWIAAQSLLKVCVVVSDAGQRKSLMAFLRQRPSLRAELSASGLLSIAAASVSKAAAVWFCCRTRGIPLQEICCFGDYFNDLEMLQLAGCSVAMGNAPEPVRTAARHVTASNDENGVALFLQQVFA